MLERLQGARFVMTPYQEQFEPCIPGECFVIDLLPIHQRHEVLNPYGLCYNDIASAFSWASSMQRIRVVDNAMIEMRKAPK